MKFFSTDISANNTLFSKCVCSAMSVPSTIQVCISFSVDELFRANVTMAHKPITQSCNLQFIVLSDDISADMRIIFMLSLHKNYDYNNGRMLCRYNNSEKWIGHVERSAAQHDETAARTVSSLRRTHTRKCSDINVDVN